jgi:hypothetical protein
MRRPRCMAALAGLLIVSASPTLAQQDGGLVGLHQLGRSGNKICMVDHFHSGSSAGKDTRKQAEIAAISDWAGFTGWEYGSHWGHWALAESKSMSCQQAGGWSCTVEARPCRQGTPGRSRR